ncbi:MAG: response regulator [Verrucomicrobiota bacterium JB022]|nr:response regulator [Verrucomicrobiota bacterium JB022]
MPSSPSISISALVFDSDREVHQLVHCLCRDLQIKSFHFLSGAEALGFYQQKPVDIVVAEVNDQAVNGITLCKRIRALHPRTPIVLLVDSPKRERLKGLEKAAGISIITKPVDPIHLARYLSEAIDAIHHGQHSPAQAQAPREAVQAEEIVPESISDLEDLKFELESAYALIDQLREQIELKDSELQKVLLHSQKTQRMLQEREAEIKRVQQVLEALQDRLEQAEQLPAAPASAAPVVDESLAERLAYIEESEERLMQRAQELFEKETELAHREEMLAAQEAGNGSRIVPLDDVGGSEWDDLDLGYEDEEEQQPLPARRLKGNKAS